jgi:glycosyltransferase
MKISVITATFNSSNTIRDALDSVAHQSYLDVEHLIIDGNSNDGTQDIVRDHLNPKICLRSEADDGIYDALNKGILYSTGDVVGFLHADDLFENNDILRKIAEVFSNPEVDAIYGDLVYVRQGDVNKVVRYWRAGNYSEDSFRWGWMLPHPTFYVRRHLYEKFGIFNTKYVISADYDSILRLLIKGKINVTYIPEVLIRMRLGGISNRSLRSILRKSFEDLRIIQENGVGFILTVLLKNLSKINQFWRR